MQVSVSLSFEAQASQSLEEVEGLILEAGRRAMREALERTVRGFEEQARQCPCGGQGAVEGSQSRVVLLSFGKVTLRLRRLYCKECGLSYRPAESFLSCLEGANVSGKLREAAVLAGSSWPYETAAGVIRQLCGAQISHEKVRQLTNAAGKAEAKRQLEEARRVAKPSLSEARAEEEAEELASKGKPKGSDLFLVGMDGGWIPSRESSGGMEGKVAVLAVDPQPIGKPSARETVVARHRLGNRAYVASFAHSPDFGLLTYAAARSLGVEGAERKAVLGDGANWIKTEKGEHFPDALLILDWAHVSRAYHKAIRAARVGKAAQAERLRLYQCVGEALWHGQADSAIKTLRSLRPKPEEEAEAKEARDPVKALEETIAYFESQRASLGNYQEWRNQGYPVGSGMVEREVELVINRRMKRQGMRWKRQSADALVTLRAKTINAQWNNTDNHPNTAKAA